MKFCIIISALLCIGSLSANAQKNRLEAGMSGYKFTNVIGQQTDPVNMFDIGYARSIGPRLSACAQYTRAPIKGWLLAEQRPAMAKESVGKLTTYNEYNYFDLGIRYELYRHGNHVFAASTYASFAYGQNSYLTEVLWMEPSSLEPNGHPFHAEYENRKEGYWGAVAALRYDYAFWKSRMNIGPEIAMRFYSKGFPFQINYGLHLGYNF